MFAAVRLLSVIRWAQVGLGFQRPCCTPWSTETPHSAWPRCASALDRESPRFLNACEQNLPLLWERAGVRGSELCPPTLRHLFRFFTARSSSVAISRRSTFFATKRF